MKLPFLSHIRRAHSCVGWSKFAMKCHELFADPMEDNSEHRVSTESETNFFYINYTSVEHNSLLVCHRHRMLKFRLLSLANYYGKLDAIRCIVAKGQFTKDTKILISQIVSWQEQVLHWNLYHINFALAARWRFLEAPPHRCCAISALMWMILCCSIHGLMPVWRPIRRKPNN